MEDKDAIEEWTNCHVDDLWINDKLILSRKLGYKCGPHGVSVPKPGYYIVRPCVNFMGMGRGAFITFIENETEDLIPDGTFWCELLKGRHLSVDFYKGEQVLCVEGHRSSQNLVKWDRWEKTDDQIKFPNILKNLTGVYDWINIEVIGGKLIEVHLRENPDFEKHNSPYIIPIYEGDRIDLMSNQAYIEAPEHIRLGFIIRRLK